MKVVKNFTRLILTFLFATILCCGIVGCEKKKSYAELMNECKVIRDSLMRLKSNDAFILKVTDEALKRHFLQIDTIIMNEKGVGFREDGRIDEKISQIPQFFVNVVSKGKVIGTIDGIKGEYSFDLETEFIRELLGSAFSREYSLTVKDKNGYYAVSVSRGSKRNIKELNEEIKANSQYDVLIDGIKVRYINMEGNAVVYSSERELSPSQMEK